jgi:hypothetical protein
MGLCVVLLRCQYLGLCKVEGQMIVNGDMERMWKESRRLPISGDDNSIENLTRYFPNASL